MLGFNDFRIWGKGYTDSRCVCVCVYIHVCYMAVERDLRDVGSRVFGFKDFGVLGLGF